MPNSPAHLRKKILQQYKSQFKAIVFVALDKDQQYTFDHVIGSRQFGVERRQPASNVPSVPIPKTRYIQQPWMSSATKQGLDYIFKYKMYFQNVLLNTVPFKVHF